jgi:phosphoribosylglycinamide formyltransferase-1
MSLPIGVLVSGRGSNLQAILEACARPGFPAHVAVVISDRERAVTLERVETTVPRPGTAPAYFGGRESLAPPVQELNARGVGSCAVPASCGSSRRSTCGPSPAEASTSTLAAPAFPGLHAQRQAIDHGAKVAGATVHFTDEGMDSGPIVLQAAVPVEPGDTEETLSARILAQEHRLYPEAIRLFAEGRLRIEGRRVIVTPGVGR